MSIAVSPSSRVAGALPLRKRGDPVSRALLRRQSRSLPGLVRRAMYTEQEQEEATNSRDAVESSGSVRVVIGEATKLSGPRSPSFTTRSPPAHHPLTTRSPPDRQPVAAGRILLESEDELRSTGEHRIVVATATALMLGTFAIGVSNLSSVGDFLGLGAGVVLAWVLSDLGSGVYHWSVDNYGSGKTPLFGGQIAAFQGHHQRPWTITEREFCNNVHKVFGPARVPAAALFLTSLLQPGNVTLASLAVFLFLVCMSQQFHAWSHMKKSQLPAIVDTMQEWGLLISRRDHGAHHKAPFDGNYCIVSGLWNPILDQEGAENGFFRSLERFVHSLTGVEPRCWLDELPEDWQELSRGGDGDAPALR